MARLSVMTPDPCCASAVTTSDIWTAIAAVAALVAVGLAYWQLHLAQKAERARLLTEWLQEYSTEEMYDALDTIRRWHVDHPSDAAAKYTEVVGAAPTSSPPPIDKARRKVAHYFWRTAVLWERRLLDRTLFWRALRRSPFDFYVDKVCPLDKAHATLRNLPWEQFAEDLWRRELRSRGRQHSSG